MKRLILIIPVLTMLLLCQDVRAESNILKQFSLGLEKEKEGDFISAIFIYQDILKKNRYFLDAKIALARSLYKTGNLSESENLLKDALKQDSKNVTILNLLGRVYISLGRFDEAEKAFKKSQEIEPVNIQTKYGIADLYRAKGEHEKAILIYNELLKLYPKEVWTYIHLGTSFTEMGEFKKAGGFFRKAVSLDSTSPWTHANLSRHYYRMGALHSLSDKESADKYFEAAIYEAKTALSIEEGFVESYKMLSSIYFYRKEYESALEAYQNLINSGVTNSIIYYDMGFCYEMLGRFEQAKNSYSTSLSKRIDDEITRHRLENIVLSLKRENLSDKKRIELSQYHTSKARYYLSKFIMDKAFLHYKHAVQLDPLNLEKRLELAELLRMQNLYELYLYELKDIIHDTLDVDTVDINDRIEIYTSKVSKNLATRWKVEQYLEDEESPLFFPKTKTRIVVFDSFLSDYVPNENFIHKRLSKSIKEMLSFILSYYPKIDVLEVSDEIHTSQDALKKARSLNIDYYITGTVEEKEDSLKIHADLISGFNGKVKNSFMAYFTGNDKVFNSIFSIAQDINQNIPVKGLIVRMRGDRALINIGSSHGVQRDMEFLIFREKGLKKDPETGEYTFDSDVSLGNLTITETDEMVSEGIYTYSGAYNRVNIYDNVLLIQEKEIKE